MTTALGIYYWSGIVTNTTTYKLLTIPQKVGAGNCTIRFNNTRIGLFYIKVTGATAAEVENKTNDTHVSLDDIEPEMDSDATLGLWKNFKTDGMNLYLGGWKYQSDSELANRYMRHSQDYLDTSYDNDIDYTEDGTPDTPTKHDEWEHPETQYSFGNEDPYYRANNFKYSNGSFTSRRNLVQPPYDKYYKKYAYNKIDNGRNEYIESYSYKDKDGNTQTSTYTGRYRFKEAEKSGNWGGTVPGDPFTVPCMGDFIKLEPTCNGTVTLYLMQNGTIDYDVSNYRKNESTSDRFTASDGNTYGRYHGGLLSKVCWRPVFIVDEAGTRFSHDAVKADTKGFITIGREDTEAFVYDNSNKKAVLCVDNNGEPTIDKGKFVEDNTNGWYVTDKDGNMVSSSKKYKRATYKQLVEASDHYDFFKSAPDGVEVWPSSVVTSGNVDEETAGSNANVKNMIGHVWGPKYTGDGWVVISKGYVKYQFDVKAGKSYYVFANDTKVGFSGYEFEKDNTPTAGTLSLKDDGTGDAIPTENTTYSSVTLNRTFNQGWNAICLPFSVTESKMREWFGTLGKDGKTYQETYELVTYNGVGRDEEEDEDGQKHLKAFFFHHVYQDIIAGYPYMLWIPEGAKALTLTDPKTNKKCDNVYFENVTVEPDAIKNKWASFTTSQDYMPEGVPRLYGVATKDCFTFNGFYKPTEVQKADYYVVPTGLQLFTNEKSTMRGYRAFLFNNEWRKDNGSEAKEMIRLSGTNFSNAIDEMENSAWENATIINDIAEEMGFFNQPQNVYSVSGQLVRANSTSLVGLPKGIYIVNGKKHLVK